jgi:hypothetical protein
MSSDLVDIFLLSLVSMFNPSLLAAVTVMLLLTNPKRLMLGYLLGAYMLRRGLWRDPARRRRGPRPRRPCVDPKLMRGAGTPARVV